MNVWRLKRFKSSFLSMSCLNRRQLGRISLVQVRITKALSIGVVGSVMGKVLWWIDRGEEIVMCEELVCG